MSLAPSPSSKKPWLALHWQILLGLVLGAVFGIVFGPAAAEIRVVGDLFVGLLKMVVMPLIFCSIVVAIAGLGKDKLGSLGLRTLGFYFLTTAIAVVIGLVLANTIQPGKDAKISKNAVVTGYEFDLDGDGQVDKTLTLSSGVRKLEIPLELAQGPKQSIVYWVVFADGERERNTASVGDADRRSSPSLRLSLSEESAWLEPVLGKKAAAAATAGERISKGVMQYVPSNPLGSMAKGEILPTVLFAIILALALMRMKKNALVIDMLTVISDAMVVIVHGLLKVTPIGVFALIATTVGKAGYSVLVSLMWYCLAVTLGLLIQTFVVYPLLIRLVGKGSPLQFFAGIKEAMLLAFSTASSSATLPVTMDCVERNLGVPKRVANFVLPLGATVNMDGTALYEAMAAMFIAQAYGMDLGLGEQVVIFLTANLAAVGAAGIPGAGLVTLALVLTAVGLPLEGLGMILAVDRILDMFRTTTNVTGDAAVAYIVGKGEPPHAEDLEDPELPEEPGAESAEAAAPG